MMRSLKIWLLVAASLVSQSYNPSAYADNLEDAKTKLSQARQEVRSARKQHRQEKRAARVSAREEKKSTLKKSKEEIKSAKAEVRAERKENRNAVRAAKKDAKAEQLLMKAALLKGDQAGYAAALQRYSNALDNKTSAKEKVRQARSSVADAAAYKIAVKRSIASEKSEPTPTARAETADDRLPSDNVAGVEAPPAKVSDPCFIARQGVPHCDTADSICVGLSSQLAKLNADADKKEAECRNDHVAYAQEGGATSSSAR